MLLLVLHCQRIFGGSLTAFWWGKYLGSANGQKSVVLQKAVPGEQRVPNRVPKLVNAIPSLALRAHLDIPKMGRGIRVP